MRTFKLALGWIMFIGGLIIAPLPIPIGQAIALVGAWILVHESETVCAWFRAGRRKIPWICRQLNRMRPWLPGFLISVIDRTDPGQHGV